MPLKCFTPSGPIYAFDLDRPSFERLRAEHLKRPHLSFGCCDGRVGLRVSPRGLQHFFHLDRTSSICASSRETEHHLRAIRDVALAVRKAGWSADTEMAGQSPEGEKWTADVMAERGKGRIAIEVQWSRQTWAQTQERQQRYARSDVRGLWLFRQSDYPVLHETPAFQLRPSEQGGLDVRVSPPTDIHRPDILESAPHWVPLGRFIQHALNHDLVWAPATKFGIVDADLTLVGPCRCNCADPLWAPVGVHVRPPLSNHGPLSWSRGEMFRSPPAWLNALAQIANQEGDRRIALRSSHVPNEPVCPVCKQYASEQHPCEFKSVGLRNVALADLPRARPRSAEWQFVYRWWLDDSNEPRK